MSTGTGDKALRGEEEYIGGKIFEGVNYTRKLEGKGKLIQIYDPTKDMSSPAYWEYENEVVSDNSIVPAGYEVRVVGATIKFVSPG
ncbi:hypothetical protein PMIN03_012620 [Paraphaeosphaeria minitans]